MRRQELTLDQMLADPIVRLLMNRDGVEDAEIRRLIEGLRARRSAAPAEVPPALWAA